MGAARVTLQRGWDGMESQKALGSPAYNIGVALLLAFYASEVRSIFTSRSFSLLLCFLVEYMAGKQSFDATK